MDNLSHSQVLNNLKDHLYSDIYCAQEKDYHVYRNKKIALKQKYIYPNPKNSFKYMCFDIDLPDVDLDLDFLLPWECKKPNIIVKNPKSKHCHFIYSLSNEVHNNKKSSKKALAYYNNIRAEMTRLMSDIGADFGYINKIIQNPFHDHWITIVVNDAEYTLHELAEGLNLRSYQKSNYFHSTSIENQYDAREGERNCYLFNELRLFAYEEINNYRPHLKDSWDKLITNKAEEIYNYIEKNTSITGFSINEVLGITKSVSNWVWDKYEPKNRGKYKAELSLLEELKDKQVVAAQKTNETRKNKVFEAIESGIKGCIENKESITLKNTKKYANIALSTLYKYKDYWIFSKNSIKEEIP